MLPKLRAKCPEEQFGEKYFLKINILKIFSDLAKKGWLVISKLHSTCPKEHFERKKIVERKNDIYEKKFGLRATKF